MRLPYHASLTRTIPPVADPCVCKFWPPRLLQFSAVSAPFSKHFRIFGGPFSFCIHSQASQPPLLLAGIIRGYATLHQPAQLSYSSPQPSVTQSILSAFAKKVLCNFEETGGCEIPALVVYEGSRGEFSVSNSSRSAPIGRLLPCVPITNFPSQLLPSHNIWGKSRYLGRVHNYEFRLPTSIYVHFLCKVIDSITQYVPHVVLG